MGVHDSKTFIAMEYVEGKTLREIIDDDELTIEQIKDISIQICEGLHEAHSKGITHRDIKPENILIDETGKVKIVDFGLAKIKNVRQRNNKGRSYIRDNKIYVPGTNKKSESRSSFGYLVIRSNTV